MIQHYIGLTIGPIIETLSQAKKTRGLWAGSYMFSFVMKTMVTDMSGKGYVFLSPEYDTIPQNGSGLFHDRFIASSNNELQTIKSDISATITKALDNITDITCNLAPNGETTKAQVKAFYEEFFQISCTIIPAEKITNIFKDINNILDTAELQYSPIGDIGKHNIFQILNPNPYIKQREIKVSPLEFLQHMVNNSDLLKDAYGSQQRDGFPSTVEIAGANFPELKGVDFDFEETDPYHDLEQRLKGQKQHLEKKHKYFAIIQADGDNIGSVIESVGSDPNMAKEFSKTLFEFASTVPDIALKYGAKIIYCGGDDILAFAPLTYSELTIFDFMEELNSKFKEAMGQLGAAFSSTQSTSLSFGVAAVYYKHPLYEALSVSRQKLEEAKNTTSNSGTKNALVFELIRHSGQSYKTIFQFCAPDIYGKFKELLIAETTSSAISHSLHHSLSRSSGLIDSVRDREDFPERLENIFTNNFNEEIHKDESTQKGLNLARELLQAYFAAYKNYSTQDIFSLFFNALSVIKIFRGDR